MTTSSSETPLSTDERLDPEWKAKWLEALRSGRYFQGRRTLRGSETNFCCLGVLCDLTDPNGWVVDQVDGKYRFDTYSNYISPRVERFVGLHDEAASTLMTMNDSGKSFGEIADWIEANL